MKRLALLVLAAGLAGAAPPPSSQARAAAFYDEIAKQRTDVGFAGGTFTGPGAGVIAKAVEGTQYVMIGEDHGIAEIPAFSTALCRTVAPQGYHTLAVETGPSTARVLGAALATQNPPANIAAYDAQHPFSIAFYDFSEEFAFLQACRQAMGVDRFALWGLDQELMGSSGALLAATAAAIPPAQSAAKAQLEQFQAEDSADLAKAMKSGSPGDMSMVNLKETDLAALKTQLNAAGISTPQLDEFIVSENIYHENTMGDQKSNLDRTQLHRYHFVAGDRAAFANTGDHPKVLVKMGAYHLFEGISMLGDRELGNFLAEYAALQGQKTLNLLVLGAKGEQLAFAGMGRPYAPVPLDLLHDKRADFAFLAPFFKNLGATPVLYDLRELRRPFARSGFQSVDLSHVIDGYDLLVVIPTPHPSHQVS
ncbi:MAG TPA: hypothetical protein VHR97_07090 [Candidatus Baltobacteraceae bacterium]|nr:hypothetical protein [Candidatus Baltobacteraceae bacterium]